MKKMKVSIDYTCIISCKILMQVLKEMIKNWNYSKRNNTINHKSCHQ